MPETFLLIPGRTSEQGTTLNEGKYTDGYLVEIGTLQVAPQDMQRLNLKTGDIVRLRSDFGEVTVPIKASKGDELPPGLLFISYGDKSSRLMGGETHGSGMPDSKCFDVTMEKVQS
jgi:formylmethanofuran dehydrogenase subunit D